MPPKTQTPTYDAHIKEFAYAVDFWRGMARDYLKRALRAEAMLAEHEGPIPSVVSDVMPIMEAAE